MKIEVLGAGCPKCKKTEKNVKKAVKRLGIEAEVVEVFDMPEVVSRGVTETPAVMIDGELEIAGKIPEVKDIVKLLSKYGD